jgi:hypothetical protein
MIYDAPRAGSCFLPYEKVDPEPQQSQIPKRHQFEAGSPAISRMQQPAESSGVTG